MDCERLIASLYSAFNDRDIDVLVAQMTEDVDWPNAWEGGRVHGHDGVRGYWTRQWAAIDPTVEAGAVTTRPDGKVAVDVHQLVRSLDGTLLGEGDVVHVYSFRRALIARRTGRPWRKLHGSATLGPSKVPSAETCSPVGGRVALGTTSQRRQGPSFAVPGAARQTVL
jgi:hypothetical protein